jgi:hypothetical protein
MMNRSALINIVFGFTMMLGGFSIVESGTTKGGFSVPSGAGHLVLAFGAAFLLYGLFLFFRKSSRPQPRQEFICPTCESVIPLSPDDESICPHDGSPLEPLKGYYDRHPERREGPVTPNQ